MALIVITVVDNADGHADVSVVSEPGLVVDPATVLTPAQNCAMTMLNALQAEPVVKDRGLIELIQL
jgi:hypothetical protein